VADRRLPEHTQRRRRTARRVSRERPARATAGRYKGRRTRHVWCPVRHSRVDQAGSRGAPADGTGNV
jgi:hypothetical protein